MRAGSRRALPLRSDEERVPTSLSGAYRQAKAAVSPST
jgi:hypothetical protein